MPDESPSRTGVGYQGGFGNHFASEALPGALPEGRNSPQRCPYGLYAEQISGTAFTAPRARNQRTWLYRIRPSVVHGPFTARDAAGLETGPFEAFGPDPNQMRWDPPPMPAAPTDFLAGLTTVCGNGSPEAQAGVGIHLYAFNRSMDRRYFYDADGELLFVPWSGALELATELGVIEVAPGEIAVIPRGIRFSVQVGDEVRGYVCENYGQPLALPELGPIGANGLANPRDFLAPVARFEDEARPGELVAKLGGKLWRADVAHSPLDVVAWHGNLVPYKYDLARFNAVNTVTFDHCDPSIFTVLTSASDLTGTANLDFVIFPPRWMVAEETFRPPWFHRNVMSEFMGLVRGTYDAKAEGFVPGGASLHNCMSPHGPDAVTFERASTAELRPQRLEDTLAFMFESRWPYRVTRAGYEGGFRQRGYQSVWQGLGSNFDPGAR